MSKKKIILITFFTTILVSFFILTIFTIIKMGNSKIAKNITINNIDVSGLTKEQAKQKIDEIIQNKNTINLKYNDEYKTTIYYSNLEINYDTSSAINKAYNIGKTGNIFENDFNFLILLFKNININIDTTFNTENYDTILFDLSANLPDKMVQTNYYIEDEELIITKGTSGNVVDTDKFSELLNQFLSDISSDNTDIQIPVKQEFPNDIDISKIHSEIYQEVQDAYYETNPFKVHPEIIGIDFDLENAKNQISENPDETEYIIDLDCTYPKTTIENLDIDIFPDLLSSFSTKYDASKKDRSTNLQIATDKIDGTIIAPGKQFSYNKIVGARTIAAGYKEAKVYSNGEVVDGIGGGICQISSTLYDAAVFANLDITERYNHQFLTSYVPAGRDATVAYGSKDLKFVNNRTYPIKIVATVNSGIVKIEIYGIKEDDDMNVSFDVETVSNIPYNIKYVDDSSLENGTEKIKQLGANGIIVNTYKIVTKNNIIVSKELISKDTYNAMDRIILKGTKK